MIYYKNSLVHIVSKFVDLISFIRNKKEQEYQTYKEYKKTYDGLFHYPKSNKFKITICRYGKSDSQDDDSEYCIANINKFINMDIMDNTLIS